MRLRREEDVYQDGLTGGGWIAAYRTHDGWIRIGAFGSRDAAVAAVVRGRARIIKSLAAARLIKMMPVYGSPYACVITEAGMVRYEEIAARKRGL